MKPLVLFLPKPVFKNELTFRITEHEYAIHYFYIQGYILLIKE